MDFIKTCFTAEKNESLIFMAFGLLTIGFSIYALLKWCEVFYKGFATQAILIGIIQLVVGGEHTHRRKQQQYRMMMPHNLK